MKGFLEQVLLGVKIDIFHLRSFFLQLNKTRFIDRVSYVCQCLRFYIYMLLMQLTDKECLNLFLNKQSS